MYMYCTYMHICLLFDPVLMRGPDGSGGDGINPMTRPQFQLSFSIDRLDRCIDTAHPNQ